MTYIFQGRPRYYAVIDGQLASCDGPPGTNPDDEDPTPDTAVTHGREITAAHVGPHSTPAGTTYNTRQTISSNNATISGNIYNKGLTVTGNGNTITDCYIGDDTTSDFANLIVTGQDNTVEFNEIDNQSKVYYGIAQRGGSVAHPNIYRRNNIHHGGFGINAEDTEGWEFTENYVHHIVAPDPAPYEGDDVWHADAIIAWGSDATIARNKLLVPIGQTGVINFGIWSGSTADISGITIEDNYLAGAGYIFYVEEKDNPTYDIVGMVIDGNDIGQDFYSAGGANGVWYEGYPPDTPPTVTGNRLVDGSGNFVSNIDYYE